ncbi:10-hydroxy-9-(phosphonooxy)octadecanoate phosphatase [Aureococcus anophagefferens]|nr:10-hydroxy-9-(phosphonooxy)octadecanoate phosphatase [Aureococcus anophagefferens]
MAPIRGESLGTLYRTIVQEAEYSRRRDVRSERLGLIEQLGYVHRKKKVPPPGASGLGSLARSRRVPPPRASADVLADVKMWRERRRRSHFVPIFDAAAAEASEVEAYARAWATGGDGSRDGAGAEAEWLRGFGPIDVGCRIEIDRVGLDGGRRSGRAESKQAAWARGVARSAARARASSERGRRRLGHSFYDGAMLRDKHGKQYGALDDDRVSNHHIKIVATLATLGEPSIRGAYYADLDTSVAHPWAVDGDVLDEHARGESDVTFGYGGTGPSEVAAFRWQVRSSRFYARDSPAGRAFFARWFANRCTFKDQFSLFHTILELAGDAGCVDYRGEVWSELTYKEALHGSGADLAARLPGVALDCARVDARCPDWTFRKRGASFTTRGTPLENTTKCVSYDPEEYVAKLGIRARDRTRHAWG